MLEMSKRVYTALQLAYLFNQQIYITFPMCETLSRTVVTFLKPQNISS